MHKFIPFFMLLTGCVYSINMVHSEGTATDLIDENQTASPDISPTIALPLANGAGVPRNYPPQDPHGVNGPVQPC